MLKCLRMDQGNYTYTGDGGLNQAFLGVGWTVREQARFAEQRLPAFDRCEPRTTSSVGWRRRGRRSIPQIPVLQHQCGVHLSCGTRSATLVSNSKVICVARPVGGTTVFIILAGVGRGTADQPAVPRRIRVVTNFALSNRGVEQTVRYAALHEGHAGHLELPHRASCRVHGVRYCAGRYPPRWPCAIGRICV